MAGVAVNHTALVGEAPKNGLEVSFRVITERHAGECGGDCLSVVCCVSVYSESQQAVCAYGRHVDHGDGPQRR